MGDSQSFVTVKKKAAQITQWWDLSAKFMEQCSTPLAESVLKILKATALENPSARVALQLSGNAAAEDCGRPQMVCAGHFGAAREGGMHLVLP